MTERLSVTTVFRAHWKGLTKPAQDGAAPEADKGARIVLIFVPLLSGVAVAGLRLPLSSPAIVVAALSLLTGSLLTVFTQLSILRLKLTEWYAREDVEHRTEKDSIDESVAHVLTAALLSLTATLVAVVATVISNQKVPVIQGIVAAFVVVLVAYVVITLIMLIPRLYGAYVSVHDVEDDLNGEIVDRRNSKSRRMLP